MSLDTTGDDGFAEYLMRYSAYYRRGDLLYVAEHIDKLVGMGLYGYEAFSNEWQMLYIKSRTMEMMVDRQYYRSLAQCIMYLLQDWKHSVTIP